VSAKGRDLSAHYKSIQDAQKIRDEIIQKIKNMRSNARLQRILNCAQVQFNEDTRERCGCAPKRPRVTEPLPLPLPSIEQEKKK
jgi:hypothetical protein